MLKISFLKLMVIALCFHQIVHVNAQYTPKPTGVAAVVQSIVTTATDTVENAFETAEEATDILDRLLKNALYTMVNNPFTRLTAGFRNRAVGSSLVMLRSVYVDALEMVVELLDQRMDRLNEVRDQVKRASSLFENPIRELKESARCLTTGAATQITDELLKCAVESVQNTLTEMDLIQRDVSNIFEKLRRHLNMRSFCLAKGPQEAVDCLQDIISDTPSFLEMIQTSFSAPPSLYGQMQTINECTSELKHMVKQLCPAYYRMQVGNNQ